MLAFYLAPLYNLTVNFAALGISCMDYEIKTYYVDKPLIIGRALDVFTPETVLKDTAFFIVHGGGWRAGSRTSFHKIMEALAQRGYISASADYRLNAQNAFCQLADIRAAYDKFASLLKQNGRPVKIVVYGESAGAHLASLMTCAKPNECGEENNLENEWVKPHLGIFQATPVDFLPYESIMPHFWNTMQNIAGAPYRENPEIYERLSLKNYIRKDNPPLFFLEAERENMFMPQYTLEVVKKHRAMGINSQWKMYRGVEHGFFFDLTRIAQRQALEDICNFADGKFFTDIPEKLPSLFD